MSSPELTVCDTGTVRSGDVELFYRRFGARGDAAPILILHGAAYYDSADWVEVAAALALEGREVVAFDARGYGRSEWSPTADYSLDAQVADISALLDRFGWQAPVLLGHSRGGTFTLRFASARPQRVGAVIFADSFPGRTARGPAPVAGAGAAAGGPTDSVYPTLAQALASTSRDPSSLEDGSKRARLEQIFTPAEGGGYRLALRDPKFQQGASGGPFDGWAALAELEVPTLIIRATRSLAADEATVTRVRDEVSHASYTEIASGHDLANEAPDALVAAVRRFLA